MSGKGLRYAEREGQNAGVFDESEGGMPLEYDPSFTGPVKKRSFQDALFFIIFVGFWVGMAVVSMNAIDAGDTRRLVSGIDTKGALCGAMNYKQGAPYYDMRLKPNLYYLNPSNKSSAICVADCPRLADDVICDYQYESTPLDMKLDVRGTHCFNKYRTRPTFNKCFPTGAGSGQRNIDDILLARTFERVVGDLYESTDIIFGCCGLAVFVSFAMLFLYRYSAFFAVYLSSLVTLIFHILICVSIYKTATEMERHIKIVEANRKGVPERDLEVQRYLQEFFYWFLTYTVILGFVLLVKQRKAGVASGIISVSMSCMKHAGSLWLWPLTVTGVILIHGIFWLFVAMNLASAGKIVKGRLEPDESLQSISMTAYHFIGLFWGMSFITAFSYLVVSGLVSTWYFTRDKTMISRWSLATSVKNTTYMLGSIALSSLVMPIISFYRFWVNLFKKHIERTSTHPMARCIWGCWNCCLECFEMGFQYVDKAAYVQMALYGGSFCDSGKIAWQLAARNVSKMQHFQNHTNFFLFVSKTAVASLCAFACWVVVADGKKEMVTSPMFPTVFTGVICYMIASAFLTNVDAVVETTLQCLCEDVERNETSPDQMYFMTDQHRDFMSNYCQVIEYSKRTAPKRAPNYGAIKGRI